MVESLKRASRKKAQTCPSKGEKTIKNSNLVFNIVSYTLLSLSVIVFLYPLIYVVSASFSKASTVMSGQMWLFPIGFHLQGYKMVLGYDDLWMGLGNTLLYTVLGTAVSLAVTISAAFPLSRKSFVLKGFLMKIYTVTMFFGGGLVPTYLVVVQLGLYDSIWAMILPGAVGVWNIIMVRTFFMTRIPNDLVEASQIDGCSNIMFFFKIAIPLSIPIIAVMSLFMVVGQWNSFFNAILYLSDRTKYPMQLIIREMLLQGDINMGMAGLEGAGQAEKLEAVQIMKYCVIIVSSLPMLILYPFVQRFFAKGMTVGSLKG